MQVLTEPLWCVSFGHTLSHSMEEARSGSVFVAGTSLRKGVQVYNEKETDDR